MDLRLSAAECRELADNGILGGVGVSDDAGSRGGARGVCSVRVVMCIWSAAVKLLLIGGLC